MFRIAIFSLFLWISVVVCATRRSSHLTYVPKHNGTKHAVTEIDITGETGQIALSALANEFVYSLHESIYLVNQAVQNAEDDRDYQKRLSEISNDATDLAFSIQKEIHGDARQLRYQIKSGIIFLALLLPEITTLIQTHENETFSNALVRESIDTTLLAVQKLEVRTELHSRSNRELLDEIEKTFKLIFEVLKNTKSEDKQVCEELRVQVYHLGHVLDKIVNKLEVWLHANTVENNSAKIVEEVAQSFGALTADLRKDDVSNLGAAQVKDKIEKTFTVAAEQVLKLSQVELGADQSNLDHAKDIFRNVLLDGVAVARTFYIQLEVISKMV